MNLVFFDLETKRGSAQVGWSRIANMGMSLAVTYSERDLKSNASAEGWNQDIMFVPEFSNNLGSNSPVNVRFI
jgi:hypothetical protein